MNLKQALARIEDLERRVAAIEARPAIGIPPLPPPVWTQPPVFWSPVPQPPPVWPNPQVTWCEYLQGPTGARG